jgi:sarcosine oxidase subunit alpha
MKKQNYRNSEGGQIDRENIISFTFNGQKLNGYEGDTLASALIANGIHLTSRSFKYHRPRGIFSSGAEEPNAYLQISADKFEEPNVAAPLIEIFNGLEVKSSNCWPSVNFDLGAINNILSPIFIAGFYYKTFMYPRWMWPFYEKFIRKIAGVGTTPLENDPEKYEEHNTHVDLLIVGGGPSGLMAALVASRNGLKVLLADANKDLGGMLLSDNDQKIEGKSSRDWISHTLIELNENSKVRILNRTSIFGYYDHNFLLGLEKCNDHLPIEKRHGCGQRLWQIRAKQVVIATGAHERSLVFANNDRPGIMLASAARTYVNKFAARPGKNCIIFTNNDSAYYAADDLLKNGVNVISIVDTRKKNAAIADSLSKKGVEIINSSVIVDVKGSKHVSGVMISKFDPNIDELNSNEKIRNVDCDLLCVSGGWNPVIHLHSQSGGTLKYNETYGCLVPKSSVQKSQVIGSANGSFTLQNCLQEGYQSIISILRELRKTEIKFSLPSCLEKPNDTAMMPIWNVPSKDLRSKKFIDYFNDVTAKDVYLSVQEGYVSVEHFKRYTTTGMGIDQGKTGNINGLALLAKGTGSSIAEVGTTTYRPPFIPVTFGALSGGRVENLYKPLRCTPMHAWHESNTAVFEDFGLWRRPQYYSQNGKTMQEAIEKEVNNVRNNVGMIDISTLGKIHLRGPDVAEFLNRIYTNKWSKLPIGKCRYGVMLKEDGMLFDDGVTSRISELEYHMTTTTGGATAVYNWMNDLLQTDWPGLRVHMVSVTTQWAGIAVAGPNARKIMQKVFTDIDLTKENFPFMSFSEGQISGIPVRIFSVSFTGELSYEINVPSRYGMFLWKLLIEKGKEFKIKPFGVESMSTMRLEKGHFIIGQDTDGTVSPHDLGLHWLVKEDKEQFLGKRALQLAEMTRNDRNQFVGLISENNNEILQEGGQILREKSNARPLTVDGLVTSSCISPTLGKSIALGVLKNGRKRIGEKLHVYSLGHFYNAEVCEPHFYDVESKNVNQ